MTDVNFATDNVVKFHSFYNTLNVGTDHIQNISVFPRSRKSM